MTQHLQQTRDTWPNVGGDRSKGSTRGVANAPTSGPVAAAGIRDHVPTRRSLRQVAVVGAGVLAWAGSVLLGSAAGATAKKPTHHVSPAMALARAEAIAPSSYPSGWKPAGSGTSDPYASFYNGASSSDVQQMSTCLGTSAAHVDPSPTEYAADSYYDPNSDIFASDSVEVFPTADAAKADITAAGATKIPTCLSSIEGANYTQDLELFNGKDATSTGTLAVTEGTVPGLTTTNAVESMSLPVTYQGLTGPSYLDLVFVQAGPSESIFTIFNSGEPIPDSVVSQLATAAAKKLQGGHRSPSRPVKV
jgi:hypothetical protein